MCVSITCSFCSQVDVTCLFFVCIQKWFKHHFWIQFVNSSDEMMMIIIIEVSITFDDDQVNGIFFAAAVFGERWRRAAREEKCVKVKINDQIISEQEVMHIARDECATWNAIKCRVCIIMRVWRGLMLDIHYWEFETLRKRTRIRMSWRRTRKYINWRSASLFHCLSHIFLSRLTYFIAIYIVKWVTSHFSHYLCMYI